MSLGKPADTALPQGRKRIPAVLVSFGSTKPFNGFIPAPGWQDGSGETGYAYLWLASQYSGSRVR